MLSVLGAKSYLVEGIAEEKIGRRLVEEIADVDGNPETFPQFNFAL